MKFRPCIDLHQGVVKQIVGSTLTESSGDLQTNFESQKSARHYAELYRHDHLKGGHVIMLGKSKENEEAALEAVRAYPGGLQVGGGITPDNAFKYLDAGASHVIVTSYVFKDGKLDFELLDGLSVAVGKERLVLDLSCRKKKAEDGTEAYFVVTDRWQKFTDLQITQETLQRLAHYCDEFLVHGVDVEGMRVGIQEDLVELLGRYSPIRTTYAGGANSMDDLERVNRLGNGKVDLTIGSALDIFGGDVKYADVVEWQRKEEDQA